MTSKGGGRIDPPPLSLRCVVYPLDLEGLIEKFSFALQVREIFYIIVAALFQFS